MDNLGNFGGVVVVGCHDWELRLLDSPAVGRRTGCFRRSVIDRTPSHLTPDNLFEAKLNRRRSARALIGGSSRFNARISHKLFIAEEK